MPRELTNVKFKRVALVDKGANFDKETKDGAHILLWKRHSEEKKSMNLLDLIKKAVGIAAEPDAEKRTAEANELTKALEQPGSPEYAAAHAAQLKPGAGAMHPDHIAQLKAHYANLSKMIDSYGTGPHTSGPVVAMKSMREEVKKALGDIELEIKEDKVDEVVLKAEISKATSDLEKRLKESEDANKATAELLKSERNQRLDNEMVILLKSFKATSLNVDLADEKNDIKKFRKMQEADPDGYARMIEIFKAADVQLAQNLLFQKNMGSGRSGVAGSAEAQLVAKAQEIRKNDSKLTDAQAFDQASMENPALVRQYRAEQQ